MPKTLSNLCKALKAGRPGAEKLIEVTLNALGSLDEESLLKAGPDLANLCALAHEYSADSTEITQAILTRVGRLDNDLVVHLLRNKAEVLLALPKLLKDIVIDLVKYYFKSQAVATEKEIIQILKLAVGGSAESSRAIAEALIELHRDR